MQKITISIFILLLIVTSCKNVQEAQSSKIQKTKVQSDDGRISSVSGERKISGVYPHLTTYAHKRIEGDYKFGNETGIGALAEWNDKLFMITYAAHEPQGSEHQLYIVDKNKNMEVFSESIGGTPTARMVHQESNQLLLGPYVIDSIGNIRIIPYSRMEGRLNAYARHLKDPENMVYMYDMEGMLYEVNVHDLSVKKLFHDPLPGWHGKGAYTSQGRLVVSNNGEHASEGRVTHNNDDWENEHYEWEENWKVDKEGVFGPEKLGVLAEFDGENFKIIERKQFTDITTRHGIFAVPNDQSPLWAIGWDKKSVRLKVLDDGKWHTYLIPKAAYNNDPPHGWFTEWPRIRSIGNDKMMMDMHGMFFDFPETFSSKNTAGLRPIGSHLRYIPDFMNWNGEIVLGTDETSIQGNPLAGQPQSNLWFGQYKELSQWGPASGYGAIWLKENVKVNKPSDPYLIAGFDHRVMHLQNHENYPVKVRVEIDVMGNNNWKFHSSFTLGKQSYKFHIFDKDIKAEWIRLTSNQEAKLTAAFHFTDARLNDGSRSETLFGGLADIDEEGPVNHARLYSNKTNFNLSVFAGTLEDRNFQRSQDYEFTKFDFDYTKGITDSTASEALRIKNIWKEDEASIILSAKSYKLRLPKVSEEYSKKYFSGSSRVVREVESERELANIAGTFYELPLFKVGQEPLYKMMRPVATHGKQISDFNTWNGLLVLSGVKKNAKKDEHIYTSADGEMNLWFGGIDDIWHFGKPIGVGGPWKNTRVKANNPSDRYLMTGYDKKELSLKADKDVEITLLLNINHYLEDPIEFKTFHLKAGQTLEYAFPEGFSAHWAQLKANKDCTATAWFTYK